LARRPEYLLKKIAPATQIVKGDLLDSASLESAFKDVETAYYLAHSMGSKGVFAEEEKRAAENFVNAARKAGTRRLIYLGGLSHGDKLSRHLASRLEVGKILRNSGIPTIEFRASIIIGSGSVSFEMIRALVDRLPVMITPRWVWNFAQPIAIEDVIGYLTEAVDKACPPEGAVYEIGGSERVSYVDLMKEYARQRGLKRLIIPVPVLSPYLSSLWLGLITPLYARIGEKLIDSIRYPTIVEDPAALGVFSIKPRGYRAAIARALSNEDEEVAATRWSDAQSSSYGKVRWGGQRLGSRLIDTRSAEVSAPFEKVFAVIEGIGGKNGWYYAQALWKFRGWIDLLLGGVGMRRGRRDPEHLLPGDTVDCWRVETLERGTLLRLFAEMKLPGRAWLQFEVRPNGPGSVVTQTAIFDPAGIFGTLYWYALYPAHELVFGGMLKAIVKKAAGRLP
jgi:uncharacterized protein YbjT (DUF2867 family)